MQPLSATPAAINGDLRFGREWDRFRDEIIAAMPRLNGTCTEEGLRQLVESGQVGFWAGDKAWAMTVIMEHELCRAMNVFLAGGADGDGGHELVYKLLPVIEKTARDLGCKFIHMDVRRGFIRRGDHVARGYKELCVSVAKDLSHG